MNYLFKRNLFNKCSYNFAKTIHRSFSAKYSTSSNNNNDIKNFDGYTIRNYNDKKINRLNDIYKNNNKNNDSSNRNKKIFFGAVGTTALLLGAYKYFPDLKNLSAYVSGITEQGVGKFRPDLPTYTLSEVSKHTTNEQRIWVIYKQGVYDVTEFVAGHPGGNNILLAAGTSVEPFWMIYGIHKTKQVYTLMEKMRIGNVSKKDAEEAISNMDDPYANDPKRDSILRPGSLKPFNAEPVPDLLVQNFITPNHLFYVRNHLPVPVVDPATYELEIEIEGGAKTVTMTLDQIKKFPKHTITASIMCAGNRRSEMSKIKEVKGLGWGHAVIGNAIWTGVRLRDVLNSVGITGEENFKHVQFEGLDVDVTNNPYGGSIPFYKAMDSNGDVILAYEMNGEPLPRDHGYPIRAVVPGTVGARNVKWLGKIVISNEESPAFWQQNDYKGFNPSVEAGSADYTKAQSIQQLPVTSAICVPENGKTVKVKNGCIPVKGYAWSGGGSKIYRVDVTIDGGKTWHVADVVDQGPEEPPKHWGWTLWSADIPVDPNIKTVEIWAKAVDSSYNTQPETFEHIWNIRGLLSNAYHRITVNVKE